MDGKHILFVSRPTGYELIEREGDPPALGARVDLDENGASYEVVKVAPSPLPQDTRLCAYLERA
ncbi:MAG TPA: hypothetical protein VH281_04500 [Gaiellaceae bacterium]|jgi:hypothetical protein